MTVPWGLVQEVYLGMAGVVMGWTGRMDVEVIVVEWRRMLT